MRCDVGSGRPLPMSLCSSPTASKTNDGPKAVMSVVATFPVPAPRRTGPQPD